MNKRIRVLMFATFPCLVCLDIVKAFMFEYIFDNGIKGTWSFPDLCIVLFACLSVYLLLLLGSCTCEWANTWIIQEKIKGIRENVLCHFFHHYHISKENEASFYMNLLTNDVSMLQDNYYQAKFDVFYLICVFLISCFSVLIINPIMLVCIFVGFLPIFLFPKLSSKKLNEKAVVLSDSNNEMIAHIDEAIQSLDTVYEYDAHTCVEKKTTSFFQKYAKAKTSLQFFQLVSSYAVNYFGIAIFLFEQAVGIYLLSKGELTIGELMAVIQLSNTIISPVSQIIAGLNKIQTVKELRKRIGRYTEVEANHKEVEHFSFDGILLKDITYSIHDRVIFDHLSCRIEPYDHILLQGGNGSGKSTLCKLITNRITNYQGNIRIQLDEMMYVEQKGFLFDDSISFNLTLGSVYAQAEIKKVIQQCCLEELIKDKGFAYMCGVGGSNLSGGEQQRILLARALLRNKKMYILDESLSAVDQETRAQIEQNIFYDQGKLFIYISHIDVSAKEAFNKIFTIQNQKIQVVNCANEERKKA